MSLPAWDGLGQKVPYRQVTSGSRHGLSMPEVDGDDREDDPAHDAGAEGMLAVAGPCARR